VLWGDEDTRQPEQPPRIQKHDKAFESESVIRQRANDSMVPMSVPVDRTVNRDRDGIRDDSRFRMEDSR
jgi:hypothetical protein